MNSKMRKVICTALAVVSLSGAAGAFSTVSADTAVTSGSYSSSATVKGWKTVNGKTYYFGKDGYLTGFKKIGGKTYYFGTDGVMRTGRIKLNGKLYDFGSDGALKTTAADTKTAKASADDGTGIKWGIKADKVRDWRFDAVVLDEKDGETVFMVPGENLRVTTYTVNDKYGLYMSVEQDPFTKPEDGMKILKLNGYKPWFSTTVDEQKVYAYKKGDSLVFIAGGMKSTEGVPGSVTYKKTTVSPAYAKAELADKQKAAAFAKAQYRDVMKDYKKPEPTSKPTGLLPWDITEKQLKKKIDEEDKSGKSIHIVTDETGEVYQVMENDERLSVYTTKDGALVMQEKYYLDRSLSSQKEMLKKQGYSEWMTVEKNDSTVFVFSNGKNLVYLMEYSSEDETATIAFYPSPAYSEQLIGGKSKAVSFGEEMSDYVFGQFDE
ncbi:MAG: hypothetical protein J6I96_01805 [Oscillospiraceae bacterium]|nr:hypothetical protein [Oscillospiraceae bacterium]